MKKNRLLYFIILCIFFAAHAACASGDDDKGIKKAKIPNINMTPNLKSVMSKINDDEGKIETNGDILNSNIIVDDIEEPKCVFYGNYNSGSGDAEQYFDIETIIFECE